MSSILPDPKIVPATPRREPDRDVIYLQLQGDGDPSRRYWYAPAMFGETRRLLEVVPVVRLAEIQAERDEMEADHAQTLRLHHDDERRWRNTAEVLAEKILRVRDLCGEPLCEDDLDCDCGPRQLVTTTEVLAALADDDDG